MSSNCVSSRRARASRPVARAFDFVLRGRSGSIYCSAARLRPLIFELAQQGLRVGTVLREDVLELDFDRRLIRRQVEGDYRIYDHSGQLREELEPSYHSCYRPARPYWRRVPSAKGASARGEPVKGTGRSTYRYRNYVHRPHLQGERRLDGGRQWEEGEVYTRPSRRAKSLPSTYETKPRKIQRSWKEHRASQWKENPAPRKGIRKSIRRSLDASCDALEKLGITEA